MIRKGSPDVPPRVETLEGLNDSESMFIPEEKLRGRGTTEKRLEPKNGKIQPATPPQDLLAAIMARLERLDQQMLNIAERSSGSSA